MTLSVERKALRAERRREQIAGGAVFRRSWAGTWLAPLLALVLIVGAVTPIAWIVLVSFMPNNLVMKTPPTFVFEPTLQNYVQAITSDGGRLVDYMMNSIVITVVSTVVALVLSVIGAYGIARLRPPGHSGLSLLILMARLLPPVGLVVPLYLIAANTGLLDTRIGLILPYIALNIPLATWFLQGFFMDLPQELEEAARVDGCNRFTAFVRIILPLAGPGIAAASVFCFALAWNDMVLSLPLTLRESVTLPSFISQVRQEEGVAWGQLGAITVIIMAPIMTFTLFVQRWIVGGMSAGAAKG